MESSTLFRDTTRKIVEKIPLSGIMGDFYLVGSTSFYTNLLVVVSLDMDIIAVFLENQNFLPLLRMIEIDIYHHKK
jgi:hypothetical protein